MKAAITRVGALLFLAATIPSAHAATLHSSRIAFQLDDHTGAWQLTDRRTGVLWESNPNQPRFAEAVVRDAGQARTVPLVPQSVVSTRSRIDITFAPLPGQPTATLRIRVALGARPDTLDFDFQPDPSLALDSLRLLDDALGVTSDAGGYLVSPTREGLLIPADSGLAYSHRFDTYAYEGCHMAMFGAVKSGSAALVSWSDPYVAVDVRSTLGAGDPPARTQRLGTSVTLRKSAHKLSLHLLGNADYISLGQRYRQIAQDRGYVVTWDRKIRENPARAAYLGASNFKLWSLLDRSMNEESTQEKSATVNWTFAEAAEVAEHLKRDLRLERVLFPIGGWIHRGYDNQHPDVLPAAPECGGDPGLADCARRIQSLGYIFSLHDNYQDIYRDSPSWSERWIARNPDGSLVRGGAWAGGRAYITCSRMALDLARRPQNLPAVQKLTGARSYFIDTTYAAGLGECFDPQHPMDRSDDMRWKIALSDYARSVFGSFGSECGREWAIPHSDFFEGLTGVSGQGFHDAGLQKKLGAAVIPLFEVVYRDCIAMYGKYGYDPAQASDYVLHHVALGRPLHYHNVPAHLYWKEPFPGQGSPPPGTASNPAAFVRGDGGWTAGLHPYDRFVKNTHEILSPLNELTARLPPTQHEFLDRDRRIQRTVFGSGSNTYEVVVNGSPDTLGRTSKFGGHVELPPGGLLVEGRDFIAFLATRWGGHRFSGPTLFTLRSTDGRPLESSRHVHTFHGFGDPALRFRGQEFTVNREMELTFR